MLCVAKSSSFAVRNQAPIHDNYIRIGTKYLDARGADTEDHQPKSLPIRPVSSSSVFTRLTRCVITSWSWLCLSRRSRSAWMCLIYSSGTVAAKVFKLGGIRCCSSMLSSSFLGVSIPGRSRRWRQRQKSTHSEGQLVCKIRSAHAHTANIAATIMSATTVMVAIPAPVCGKLLLCCGVAQLQILDLSIPSRYLSWN